MNYLIQNKDAITLIFSGVGLIINIILVSTIIISAKGLKETVKSKESMIFTWALDQIKVIRPVMNEIKGHKGDQEWLSKNHAKVLSVIDVLQMISFMAIEGMIDKKIVSGMWGKSFTEQWDILESFVKEFRSKIGESQNLREGAYFARSLEEFAEYSLIYLNSNFPKPISTKEKC